MKSYFKKVWGEIKRPEFAAGIVKTVVIVGITGAVRALAKRR